MKSTIYLVDVSSMFFRAFYAVRPLTNSKGLPTNAIYGFLSMVLKLLREKQPDYICFCLDSKEPSFRKELDPNYKAQRTEMPEDLAVQIPYIIRIAGALGIRTLGAPGYEADDIIGTLARASAQRGMDVRIVSGDKDFAQLVSHQVHMLDTMKEIEFDEAQVLLKWGVRPDQFIDYLAIVGDSSDNIPGVAGVGPKGAVKLLQDFGSLDGIYGSLEKISSQSMRDKLLASKDQAYRAQKLVRIVTDMELPLSVEDLVYGQVDRTEIQSLLSELEFRSFERLLDGVPSRAPGAAVVVEAPRASREFELQSVELKEFLTQWKPDAEVWLMRSGSGFLLGQGTKLFSISTPLEDWAQILGESSIKWAGFDLKSHWRVLHLKDPHAIFDCSVAVYVLEGRAVKSMEEELRDMLGVDLPPLAAPSDIYEAHLNMAEKMLQRLPLIQAQKVMDEIELPIIRVLYHMEETGFLLDRGRLAEQSAEALREIQSLELDIFELAGESFNIGSPKQLARILFEKLRLPVQKKTKTGFSTDNEVLETLSRQHPICERLIQYREVSKLRSTYLEALPQLMDPQTERIHTTFNQTTTATGRLSSSNPNLQNIPIRTPRGARIRRAFRAPDGFHLVSADYSQIELRILAHITNDPGLISAFERDLDIHQATASEIYGVPLAEVGADLRRAAKAVNFGIAYGQGAFGLSQSLGISRGEAQDIIDRYFKKFRGVAEYMSSVVETAKRQGYVETLFGRRRYLPELKSAQQAVRKFGERAAINAPIQGTASDLVKMSMVQIFNDVQTSALGLHMILQVHDELIFECPIPQAQAASQWLAEKMGSVFPMRVPLKVNAGHGVSWDEAH